MQSSLRIASRCLLGIGVGCFASEARARDPPPSDPAGAAPSTEVPPPLATPSTSPPAATDALVWKSEWPKFSLPEVILTSSLLLGTGAIIVFGSKGKSNWQGPILFDKPVREAIRATHASARKASQDVGDGLYYAGLAYPYLVDVVGIALIARRSSPVAAQMALINTEAFAITGFLSFVSNASIRRERPYARECTDPQFPGCKPEGSTESFYSGHTGIAFTGAALSCMHHAHLPLYGKSPVGGIATCAGMMAGATTTAVLRIIGDKHYASDVIVGAAVGLASGFFVPWFHYRSSARADDGATTRSGATNARSRGSGLAWLPAPILSPTSAGLGAVGTF